MEAVLPYNKKSFIKQPLGTPLTLIQWDPSPKLAGKSFPPARPGGQGEGLWYPVVKGRCWFQGERLWGEEAQEQEKQRTIDSSLRARMPSAPQTHRFIHLSVWFPPHSPEGPLSHLSLDSISGLRRPLPVRRDWKVSHTEAGDHFANLSNSSPFTSV